LILLATAFVVWAARNKRLKRINNGGMEIPAVSVVALYPEPWPLNPVVTSYSS
jgi:hypothetical protein